MSRKTVVILGLCALVIFVLFAPVVPLAHTWPPNTPPPSAPLAFHGSISRAVIQIGLEIDASGQAHFRYYY